MTERKEELKSLLMKMKEESEKIDLKLNIQKTKIMTSSPISSVQFSHSVMSDSLWPHELQHARPPYPSPSLRVHSNSRPSGQWYHPAISSSVIPFSSYPHSLPASEYFPVSQLFTWGGQSTGVSALASFLPICRVASDIMPGFRKSKKPPSLRGEQSDVNFVKVRQ